MDESIFDSVSDRVILGLVEPVVIMGREVFARIDTGAERSSIDEALAMELGLSLNGEIQKIRSAHGLTERPLADVKIVIAKQEIESMFTVYDRSKMRYQILIGHDVLKQGQFLIDPLKGIKL